jgi:hypothetical protein
MIHLIIGCKKDVDHRIEHIGAYDFTIEESTWRLLEIPHDTVLYATGAITLEENPYVMHVQFGPNPEWSKNCRVEESGRFTWIGLPPSISPSAFPAGLLRNGRISFSANYGGHGSGASWHVVGIKH